MAIQIAFSRKYTYENRGHVFRPGKFEAALKTLLSEGAVKRSDIVEPGRPSKADLLLAHTPEWAGKAMSGAFSPADSERAGLEITARVLEAHLAGVGGTVIAARRALRTGLGINCGGGGHHAFAGHGEGFCLFNDIAVAVNKLRAEKLVKRALIVDLDVHQGNGTAGIFRGDGDVFTFSVHQSGIYPEERVSGSLDLELPAGSGDRVYLDLLKAHLPAVFGKARPDIVVYNAGVDVYEKDLLGGLKLTMDGVRLRDEMVFKECFFRMLPAVLVLSGGYASRLSDTARLHANTMKAAITLKRGLKVRR